jgi:hypothetical protein
MLFYASQATIFSLHKIKSLVFVIETEYLYSVLQPESLNITEDKFSL